MIIDHHGLIKLGILAALKPCPRQLERNLRRGVSIELLRRLVIGPVREVESATRHLAIAREARDPSWSCAAVANVLEVADDEADDDCSNH